MATRNNISKSEILIVDDNPHILQAMSDLLKTQGLPVLTARNGWDALVKMKNDGNICLVLLDLWMPLMDGGNFYTGKRATQPSPIYRWSCFQPFHRHRSTAPRPC